MSDELVLGFHYAEDSSVTVWFPADLFAWYPDQHAPLLNQLLALGETEAFRVHADLNHPELFQCSMKPTDTILIKEQITTLIKTAYELEVVFVSAKELSMISTPRPHPSL